MKRYSVILGDGTGNFSDATAADARADANSDENIPFALAVGKLDGSDDQFDDIAISTAESFSDLSTLVAHSEGGGRFTRNPATGPFASATSISLGDIDGDGLLDAAIGVIAPVGETSLNRPEILIGDGAGGFLGSLANIKIVGGSMGQGQAIAAGNLNKDTHNLADLVQVNDAGDTIVVALNVSDGPVLPTDTPTQAVPTTPAATRTVTPTRPTSTITMTPTITATRTPNEASYGRCIVKNFRDTHGSLAGVAIGNLDGGGGDDIVLSDDKNDRLYVIPNSPELRAAIDDCANHLAQTVSLKDQKDIALPTGQKPGALVAVDLDGNTDRDSQQDLVVIGTDSVLVYWNGGGATFTGPPVVLGPFGARPSAIVADAPDPRPGSVGRVPLDLNGDGFPDIVVALPNETQLRIFFGAAGHTFVAGTRMVPLPGAAVSLASGDFDGKFPDLVAATTRGTVLLRQDDRDAQGPIFVGEEPLSGGAVTAVASAFFDNNQLADVLLTRTTGVGGVVEVHLSAAKDVFSMFSTAGDPIGAAVGAFNAADMTSDVAVLTKASSSDVPDENAVILGLGDGSGALPGVLQPLSVSTLPRALAAGLIDNDLVHDIVTANDDGTFSILLSGSALATPVPTKTSSPTVTQTPPPTQTVPSPTPTSTAVGSLTATTLPTSTPSAEPTAKAGAFGLSSCSINDQASDWPVHALVMLGALAVIRGRRRRAVHALLLLTAILIPLRSSTVRAGEVGDTPTAIETTTDATPGKTETTPATETSTSTVTMTSTATHTPTVMLGWCTVGQAELGNPTGQLVGAVAAPLDNAGGFDLALLYDNDVAIQRIDLGALRLRACSRIATPSVQAVAKAKGLAFAELDGDRLIDLIVTEQSADVVSFHNAGDGTLSTLGSRPATDPGPVAVGNLDDDTIQDLAIGSGPDVAILKGTGGGRYNAPTSLERLPSASFVKRVIVADVNLDGLDDIVAVNQNGMFGVYMQGTGTPRFSLQAVKQLEAPDDLIVEDINPNDPSGPAPDILFVTRSGLHVMLGSVSGTTVMFGTAADYPVAPNESASSEPSAVAVGRFDTDDNLDVAVADAAANVVYMFMGDGHGNLHELPPENNQPTGPEPRGLVVADFDGDLMDDLVSLNRGDGSITIFLSTAATPTFTPTFTPTRDPHRDASRRRRPRPEPSARRRAHRPSPASASAYRARAAPTSPAAPRPQWRRGHATAGLGGVRAAAALAAVGRIAAPSAGSAQEFRRTLGRHGAAGQARPLGPPASRPRRSALEVASAGPGRAGPCLVERGDAVHETVRMVGITRYGSYVPVLRLDRRLIEQAWGTRQPKGEIAVANYDEDALTLAIDAAMGCLGDPPAGRSTASTSPAPARRTPRSRWRACSPPPAICRAPSSPPTSPARRARGVSAAARRRCAPCRPDAAPAVLVAAADVRVAAPESELEGVLGDGAAALTVGRRRRHRRVRRRRLGRRGVHLSSGAPTRSAPCRWPAAGSPTTYGYGRDLGAAIRTLLERQRLEPKAIAPPGARLARRARQRRSRQALGFDPKTQLVGAAAAAQIGCTGSAEPLLLLARALDEAAPGRADPRSAATARAPTSLLFRATAAIAAAPRGDAAGALAGGADAARLVREVPQVPPPDRGRGGHRRGHQRARVQGAQAGHPPLRQPLPGVRPGAVPDGARLHPLPGAGAHRGCAPGAPRHGVHLHRRPPDRQPRASAADGGGRRRRRRPPLPAGGRRRRHRDRRTASSSPTAACTRAAATATTIGRRGRCAKKRRER